MSSNFEEERHLASNKNKRSTELRVENKVEMQEKNPSETQEQPISTNCSTNANNSFELNDDIIIIRRRDVEKLTGSLPKLESLDSKLGLASDKKYEEWVYVESDRSTFKIQQDLLLLSSVYNDERPCCVLQ